MWEIDLIINKEYVKYLFYIEDCIKNSQHYTKKGVFAYIQNFNFVTMGIAIDNPSKKLKQEIAELVAEVLVMTEKEKYILNKKIIKENDFHISFVKTLIFIDLADDIDYAKSKININNRKINIPSLFNFKMQSLKSKWDKIILNLVPEGKKLSDEMLLNILKNIINQNQVNTKIEVQIDNNSYILNTPDKVIKLNNLDEPDLIANLILLSPSQIYLNNVKLSKDTFILLSYLFNDNIIIKND